MRIVRGTFEQYKDELIPMFYRHWEEIGMAGNHDLQLNVEQSYKEYYLELEKANKIVGLGIENDDGKLIGYLVCTIYKQPHHNVDFGITDIFLVDKPYRSIKTYRYVVKMFEEMEAILFKEYGVKYLQLVSSSTRDLHRLAHNMGYVMSDVVFVKELSEGNK